MFKKIFFALMILFVGTTTVVLCPDKTSALELDYNSDIYKKIIRQNIKDCYRTEPLSSKVFPKDWPNNDFKSLFGDSKWVNMPTGYTSLEENKVTCKGLIYGDTLGSGAKGEYDGILNIYGKNISDKTGLEEKKQLAVGLGYKPSVDGELDNPQAPLYYALAYTYTSYEKYRNGTCGFLGLGMCEETNGPYDAATYVTGTKVNDNGTVANKLEIFSSGNGVDLEEAGVYFKENTDKTGGILSIKCDDFKKSWGETFNDVLLGIASFDTVAGFDCVDGDLSVSYNKTAWNDGNANNGNGASGNSVVGFLNKHLPLDFSIEHEETYGPMYMYYSYEKRTFTATGTISSDPSYINNSNNITLPGQYNKIGNWDERTVKGMEYFTEGTNRFFTNAEIYVLYAGYLTDYYKADFQCGADKAEHYDGREGYVKASNILYENEMQDVCYVKATKNADKKVNGVSFYNFDGSEQGGGMVFHGQKTFEELLNQIADLNVTPESIAEANINSSQSGTSDDDTDPCYNAGVEGMSWILCPAINNMSSSVDWLETIMRSWFSIDTNVTFQSSTKSIWGTFRNIANALLIIVLLFIIFSQLTGVGIDNYGIKKMLPRLIIMGVLINLSYVICELAVDLSNILGVGLDNLFRAIGASTYQGYSAGEFVTNLIKDIFFAIGVAGSTAGIGITIASIASGGGIAVVISLVLVLLIALVAVLMFFLMLGARMVIVIIFTVIAPVAFACYILPNTQAIFKQWWKVFKAALVMFPIAGALYGLSYIIRGIVYGGGEIQFWMALVAVFAPFLPFLLLPTLLRNAIAALGMVGGALTAMSNGLRKGLSGANSAVRSTESYKEGQKEAARRMQGNRAQRIVNRLNRQAADNNGELSARNQRRLARSYGILDKQRREDNAARTIMAEREFEGKSERELKEAWTDAYLGENLPRLDALTNLLNSRQGPKAASWMASQIYSNGARENSLAALRDNMAHSPGFDKNMSKSFDAYAMIKGAGKDSEGTSQVMSYFSRTNSMVDDEAGWAGQNKNAIMRAVQNGNAMLSKDMIGRILASTNPDIQSSLSEEKRKVLQAAYYMKDNGMSGAILTDANVDDYARRYQERYVTPGQQPSGNPEPGQPAGDSGSGAPEGGTEV